MPNGDSSNAQSTRRRRPKLFARKEPKSSESEKDKTKDKGSRSKVLATRLYNGLKTGLDLLIEVSDGLPVPIKGPLSLLRCLIDKAEAVQANREALERLESHVKSLQQILQSAADGQQSSPLNERLKSMLEDLSSFCSFAHPPRELTSAFDSLGVKDLSTIEAFTKVGDIDQLVREIDAKLSNAMMRLLIGIGIYDSAKISDIDVNSRLERYQGLQNRLGASTATAATWDGLDPKQPVTKCAEGTRGYLLRRLSERSKEFGGSHCEVIFLAGSAGSGKTAIMRTASQHAHERGNLAASYFFWSTSEARNNTGKLVATLAYGLVVNVPCLRPFILDAFAKDEMVVHGRSLRVQMRQCLLEPVQEALRSGVSEEMIRGKQINIDGLDECIGEDNQREVVESIHEVLVNTDVPFPILITISSRPEPAARFALEHLFKGHLEAININDAKYETDADIEKYVRAEFAQIWDKHPNRAHLPDGWPPASDIRRLVSASSGQFIYPSTALKYISEPRADPVKRLELVLKWGTSTTGKTKNPFKTLDNLYTAMLTKAQKEYEENSDDADVHPQAIVKLVLCVVRMRPPIWSKVARENWSPSLHKTTVEAFEHTLGFPHGGLSRAFYDLNSLIDVRMMTLYHKSLLDFLGDPTRCPPELFVSSQEVTNYLIRGLS
ncbi:hypothetical protein CC1G_05419 [Coprinopsis cinerea okayama7|uniref:Nephrocystin 3-like N-terminal domain-containing protein n=1 Tax=Coprinopsis cinerea (strain Okayama-7 / 130 / ATCC MYA-4618 / FGSC 9003) TaxID=240176 RepID=A8NQ17_COPC7|nr:hypothetical protein CC1G_05419 [Coprinopsis cinerea okayama7\|eukprot:XP_001835457.2 hypothetical protein CC1G_05419 [Coprinopsis cinerea okayama7\